MPQTRANVATPNASKYLRRLSKHWSHRFEVKYDDTQAVIDFGTSRCEMTANETHLLINLVFSAGEDVAELEAVVAEHLQRVGNDASLMIEWQRQT